MKKTLVDSRNTQTVDMETGQVIITDIQKTHVITLQDKDRFFMVYIGMLQSFYQIKYIKDVMLLIKLAEIADYNTGHVDISAALRSTICEELNLNKSNLSAIFKRLIELKLLSGEKGSYTLNAGLFWKGDAKTREKVMKEKGLELTIKFQME